MAYASPYRRLVRLLSCERLESRLCLSEVARAVSRVSQSSDLFEFLKPTAREFPFSAEVLSHTFSISCLLTPD